MALVHDTPRTIQDIFNEIQVNVYDAGLKWYTEQDILNSIQDQYNKFVALLTPIEYSTLIPKISSPYYALAAQIPDFMYLSAIYNPTTNNWLQGFTYKGFKAEYQTYLHYGEPHYFNVVDFNRFLIWPFLSSATGVLYVIFKAKAPPISMTHNPLLPYSVASQLLEYSSTADLLEQARELNKAKLWWDKIFIAPKGQKSLYTQAELEIKSLARMDREMVLEPYRWIFHGGQFNVATWVNNETPVGDIDGVNATYILAQVPNPTASLLVTKNGQILYNGVGYVLNGQTITIQSSYILEVGDYMRAWYQVL